MEPIVVGRFEKPEEEDLAPQQVTVVGYTPEREEVTETFRVRAVIPAGAQWELLRNTDQNGNVSLRLIVDFLDECLVEADREPFRAFLHRPDIEIKPGTVLDLYRAVTEYYAARPTRPPSASASTGSPAKPTSRAAARSAASRSKASPST